MASSLAALNDVAAAHLVSNTISRNNREIYSVRDDAYNDALGARIVVSAHSEARTKVAWGHRYVIYTSLEAPR